MLISALCYHSDRETSNPEGTHHPPHCEAAGSPVQRHRGTCQEVGQGQGAPRAAREEGGALLLSVGFRISSGLDWKELGARKLINKTSGIVRVRKLGRHPRKTGFTHSSSTQRWASFLLGKKTNKKEQLINI